MKYTKTKTIRLSETQHSTLVKMKSMKIDVGRFIRNAIKEKIEKEYKELVNKPKKTNNTVLDNLLNQLSNELS